MSAPARIELHVRELNQLFHTLDPSPFFDRKLDWDAEDYVVMRAREFPRDVTLELMIRVDEPVATAADAKAAGDAVRTHFLRRAEHTRRELKQLFRTGRAALAVGVVFLTLALIASQVLAATAPEPFDAVMREGLVVGGWVAMWRPLEILLYDWWPIRDQRRTLERLGRMEVQVTTSQEKP